MALTDDHPIPAPGEDPEIVADEIIDLTDRRRVMLHAVLGVTVDGETADAVFAVER